MILPQLLIVSSFLFVSSHCQEFDYDYENSPNSVEFGAPSQTPRPTTRSPSSPPRTTPTYPSAPTRPTTRSPPYWWMNSTIFSNQTTVEIDRKPGYNPGYKAGYNPGYNHGYKPGYKSGYKPGYNPGLKPAYKPVVVPPVKSIKIYECDGWAMKCEYRPSQASQYPLHCKFVAGTTEDF